MKERVPLLYEDDELVIVNKKAGDLTIPDRFDPGAFNLQRYFNQRYGHIFIVHRLDRETSGVLCMARTEAAHRHLSQQFENRTVQKIYLAIVDGCPLQEEGVIDEPIAPHPGRPGSMIIARDGRPALTHYRVLERFKSFALLEADLKTGRTHQVRVHCKAIGHPLAVDALYGKREGFYLSEVKGRRYNLGRGKEERPLLSRTALHAHKLTIDHPGNDERLTFEAELPKDMAAMLNQLRKWGK